MNSTAARALPFGAYGYDAELGLYVFGDKFTGFSRIPVKEPAFIQQFDLTAVFLEIRLHELLAKPLRQGYPSSGMHPMYR